MRRMTAIWSSPPPPARQARRGRDIFALTRIGAVAADCLARAMARAVYEAEPLPFTGALPSWREKFGR